MKKMTAMTILLALLLAGCKQNQPPEVTKPMDVEPTATYDWMAGESPIPVKRIGTLRAGLNNTNGLAVSPTGVYYLYQIMQIYGQTPLGPVILYADNDSDSFIRLCGRPDCTHTTEDCNAYVKGGKLLSFYGGYLYVITENDSITEGDNGPMNQNCQLVRMDPDGTNRIVVADFEEFAKEQGCDYAECDMITDGYCFIRTCKWEEDTDKSFSGKAQATYYYKLDGSMAQPEKLDAKGMLMYNCGEVILTYHPESENGGKYGSYWDWDPEMDSMTYLTDHPGEPGWFGKTEAYYFMDEAVRRLTYATGQEEVVIQTDLQGDYYACCFPDCIVVVSNSVKDVSDKNLYIYNWDFQLVDTVAVEYTGKMLVAQVVFGETAERILLSKSSLFPVPTHYIEKSELGTGSVTVYEFDLTAIEDMIEAVKKFYPDLDY